MWPPSSSYWSEGKTKANNGESCLCNRHGAFQTPCWCQSVHHTVHTCSHKSGLCDWAGIRFVLLNVFRWQLPAVNVTVLWLAAWWQVLLTWPKPRVAGCDAGRLTRLEVVCVMCSAAGRDIEALKWDSPYIKSWVLSDGEFCYWNSYNSCDAKFFPEAAVKYKSWSVFNCDRVKWRFPNSGSCRPAARLHRYCTLPDLLQIPKSQKFPPSWLWCIVQSCIFKQL